MASQAKMRRKAAAEEELETCLKCSDELREATS
jgi:hypothetical protein